MSAALYMDAIITPNRSLSKRGFHVLIGALLLISAGWATFFLIIGAPPIPIFLGVDVLAVFVAFKVSYAAGRRAERVQVSAEEVVVTHEWGEAARLVWSSPTAFTRVALEDDGAHEASLSLRLSDKAVTVGEALSPSERHDFAAALDRAIRRARSERHVA
ncbi:hypothetical protein C5708_06070 [Caulobacter sp. CCUG 60055]|uniref:DUF2244 domain-containing protein n=1 Tax=Caulobacter sp. CCUG 60055 TaxID=2100090 RepID=UPI001FA79382|nr:DUF2244 domain-containing protein [Caulobacter sp. CCUG 60055]MBQ1543285.1 DUF2244 domain-containing protein [Caulobacteraceae bacterium]MCI3179817.1 hypothetical protein [Caulobacter sp. CCUG 60055]